MIYLNNGLINAENAAISPLDHGYLYGNGIFETMRSYGGKVFCLEEHLDRLAKSADLLGWPDIPPAKELADAIYLLLEAKGLGEKSDNKIGKDASVRLSLSRGVGAPRPDPDSCGQPTLLILANEIEPIVFERIKSWNIITLKSRRNHTSPLCQIKSANYLENLLAKIEAGKAKADEGIFFNTDGYLAEGTMSNIFLVENEKKIITPDLDSGILPGVTRQTVINLAVRNGFTVEERKITPWEVEEASEIFLTSSIREIVPVALFDRKQLPGTAGKITRTIAGLYRQLREAAK